MGDPTEERVRRLAERRAAETLAAIRAAADDLAAAADKVRRLLDAARDAARA